MGIYEIGLFALGDSSSILPHEIGASVSCGILFANLIILDQHVARRHITEHREMRVRGRLGKAGHLGIVPELIGKAVIPGCFAASEQQKATQKQTGFCPSSKGLMRSDSASP